MSGARLVLAVVVALACAAPARAATPPAIVGGTQAPAAAWPSIAFLYGTFHAADGSERVYGCTGSVVAPDWVVTAAHCAYGAPGQPPETLVAVLGVSDYLDPQRTVIAVDGTLIDPEYNPASNVGDIAMLHLAQPASVPPMRLATRAEFAQNAYVSYENVPNAAGWGAIDEAATVGTTTLQQAYLRVHTATECRLTVRGFDAAHEICAGTEGRAGACHGDSGGPLVAFDRATRAPVLWGNTSWGPQDAAGLSPCSVALPVVFTWVPAYADWVAQTIGPQRPAPAPAVAPAVVAPTAMVPPARAPSAACASARSRLATARHRERNALKRLRAARSAHAGRKRIRRLSGRYHAARGHRQRVAASAARRCG